MRPVVATALVTLLPLLALAADPKPKDLIVGKWAAEGSKGAVVIEYTKDGNCLMHAAGVTLPGGKYKFVDDDTMELTVDVQGKQVASKYRVKVTKDDLVETGVGNRVEKKYKRVK